MTIWSGATRRHQRRVGAIALVIALASCIGRETGPPTAQLENLVRFPKDNILAFDAAGDEVIVFAGDYVNVHTLTGVRTRLRLELPGQYLTNIAAISRGEFYASGRECNALFHWREGRWIALDTMVARIFADHLARTCIRFRGLLASGSSDVTAVGTGGAIAHWNGEEWRSEPNPLESLNDSVGGTSRSILWDVGGVGSRRFATGTLDLIADTGAGWTILARPEGIMPRNCVFTTVASNADAAVLGGGHPACLASYEAGRWMNLSAYVYGFRDYLLDSKASSAGRTVSWNFFGDIVLVDGHRVKTFRLPIRNLIGAAYSGRSLIVAGNDGNDGILATVRNADWEE